MLLFSFFFLFLRYCRGRHVDLQPRLMSYACAKEVSVMCLVHSCYVISH